MYTGDNSNHKFQSHCLYLLYMRCKHTVVMREQINLLHLLHLHVVSTVTGSEDGLSFSIPQVLLEEVGSLHRPLQQGLVPQHSSDAGVGRQHQTWRGRSSSDDDGGIISYKMTFTQLKTSCPLSAEVPPQSQLSYFPHSLNFPCSVSFLRSSLYPFLPLSLHSSFM